MGSTRGVVLADNARFGISLKRFEQAQKEVEEDFKKQGKVLEDRIIQSDVTKKVDYIRKSISKEDKPSPEFGSK